MALEYKEIRTKHMPRNSFRQLREDTHIKKFFFSGRTTKRGGGPPEPLRRKPLIFYYLKITKTSWTTKPKGGGALTLGVRPLNFFFFAKHYGAYTYIKLYGRQYKGKKTFLPTYPEDNFSNY